MPARTLATRGRVTIPAERLDPLCGALRGRACVPPAVLGPNLGGLASLEAQCDPGSLLHTNQNVVPAGRAS